MAVIDDVISHLQAQGIVGTGTDWEAVGAFLPPSPDRVLVVTETAGPQGDADEGTQYDYPSFQLRGRGAVYEYDELRDKMQEAYENLHDVAVSGFIYVYGDASSPVSIGHDDNDRPQLTWNFSTMRPR